jgi:hypothetical protein
MGKHIRYALAVLLGVAVLAVLAYMWDQGSEVRWDGDYPVQVTVKRASVRPVSATGVVVLFRGEWTAAEGDDARLDATWEPIEVTNGSSFEVRVKCGGKDSALGRQLTYVRQEVLVVKVDYADGGKQGCDSKNLVENGSLSRNLASVSQTLPCPRP